MYDGVIFIGLKLIIGVMKCFNLEGEWFILMYI